MSRGDLKNRSLLVVLTLGWFLTGCGPQGAQDGGGPMFTLENGLYRVPDKSPLRTRLAVQTVASDGGAGMVEVPAQIETDPARTVNILAPAAGRVTALKVSLGQQVHAGQTLAVLASGDYAQAVADDAKAKDGLDLASRALTRAKGVEAAGGAASKDLEAAQSAYTQAQAEEERARQRLLSLSRGGRGRSRDLVLTAPSAGVVTALNIGQGGQANDPTASLMTIANLDHVFVAANLAEADVGRVKVGAAAEVRLASDPGHVRHGTVSEVDAFVAPDTRRQKVRITLPGAGLAPNLYATVRIAAGGAGGVRVPQSALLMNNDSVTVLVEVRPWIFQRRAVIIGDETEATARVISGLVAGERVVVRGGVLLND